MVIRKPMRVACNLQKHLLESGHGHRRKNQVGGARTGTNLTRTEASKLQAHPVPNIRESINILIRIIQTIIMIMILRRIILITVLIILILILIILNPKP